MSDTLIDLPFSGLQPCEHGRAVPRLPFRANGDFSTLVIPRSFVQLATRFYPAALGVVRDGPSPTSDPDTVYYSDAFLIAESDPEPFPGNPALVTFTRTFARIPPTQYEPASLLFSPPALHDIKSGSTYAVSFTPDRAHLFSSRVAVSSVGDVTGGTAVAVAAEDFGELPNAICYIADTTYNTSFFLDTQPDTIQAALEGVLSDLTSIQVSGTAGAITISWVGTVKYLYTSSAGVNLSGGAGTDGSATFTASRPSVTDTQAAASPIRAITTGSSHSGAAGGWLAAWNGDKLVGVVKAQAASGSSITIPADEGPFAASTLPITHVAFATQAAYCIALGPVDCTARRVRRFYLPGVSAGIANMADIPGVTVVTRDPISWLAAVLAYLASPSEDTYAVDATEDLRRWLDGPILEKSAIELQMQDAVIQLSVSA